MHVGTYFKISHKITGIIEKQVMTDANKKIETYLKEDNSDDKK